jgi:hypothetical protein
MVLKRRTTCGENQALRLTVIGRDVSAVALELLLDPQVEFAEPKLRDRQG